MPNLKNVLQIVVEIDGGEATRTQTVLHQNRLPMQLILGRFFETAVIKICTEFELKWFYLQEEKFGEM